jgi:hypothetical protein
MEKEFFEFHDTPLVQNLPWIPLRHIVDKHFDSLPVGIAEAEEWRGYSSVAVLEQDRESVDKLGWRDINLDGHRSGVENGSFRQADLFFNWGEKPIGFHLVLDQFHEGEGMHVWHLHPDIQIALGLIKEGDSWYRPSEGWIEAARISFDQNGAANSIEIKTELLADYLVARGMALFVSSYHE